ncbi:response regulator transcription factor [Nocardiopsis sp. HNM0947]|uniref:Response regulator transcription factor n=1 Tax=Nocardiopsis coralli TaxID=2772213 RepID=A0ABR9PDT7_9ACTN|nr:response regulator transcription factor [Nocardiopsis coralli]MBE3001986.1 response regulator transcription factor [Nocardiopsis coralli]
MDTAHEPGGPATESERPAIRVVLVDDQELVRTGFHMVLDAQPDMQVVGEAADGVQALELLGSVEADVVVLDVRMPRMDGVEATRRICAAGDHPRVLILTTFDLDEYVYAALRAGAGGFFLKDAPAADLLSAVRAVHSGDAVVAPSATRRLLDRFVGHLPEGDDAAAGGPARLEALTPREHEVLVLMARGSSNAEIAESLYVSATTVKTHVRRILTKLDLRDRVQAVVLAYETGLVGTQGPG